MVPRSGCGSGAVWRSFLWVLRPLLWVASWWQCPCSSDPSITGERALVQAFCLLCPVAVVPVAFCQVPMEGTTEDTEMLLLHLMGDREKGCKPAPRFGMEPQCAEGHHCLEPPHSSPSFVDWEASSGSYRSPEPLSWTKWVISLVQQFPALDTLCSGFLDANSLARSTRPGGMTNGRKGRWLG